MRIAIAAGSSSRRDIGVVDDALAACRAHEGDVAELLRERHGSEEGAITMAGLRSSVRDGLYALLRGRRRR